MENFNIHPNNKQTVTRKLENLGKSENIHAPIDPQGIAATIENLRQEIISKYENESEMPRSAKAFFDRDAMLDAKEIGLSDSNNQNVTGSKVKPNGSTITFDADGRLMYEDLVLQVGGKEKTSNDKKRNENKNFSEKYVAGRHLIDQRNTVFPNNLAREKTKSEYAETKPDVDNVIFKTSENSIPHENKPADIESVSQNELQEPDSNTHQRYLSPEPSGSNC
jgi:hypothetical protein